MNVKGKKSVFAACFMLLAMLVVSVVSAFIAVNITNKKNEETVTAVLSSAIEKEENKSPENTAVPEELILRQETLEELFASANDLVTMEYYYTNASDIENYKTIFDLKVPLTTDHVVFTYDGVIKAGIDLDSIVYNEIDNENKKIHITLPYPKIISNELDTSSFKFYDVKNSIFTSISPEEITSKYQELKKLQEKKLTSDGKFFDSVIKNAEDALESLISVSEPAKGYKITFDVETPDSSASAQQ